jgi:hypothetical protein
MIIPDKVGKVYKDGKLLDLKYDRNAPFGVDGQIVSFYKIVLRILFFGINITISKKQPDLVVQQDFTSLAFDPPMEKKANG